MGAIITDLLRAFFIDCPWKILNRYRDENFRIRIEIGETNETADEPLVMVDLLTKEILFLASLSPIGVVRLGYGRTVPETACLLKQFCGTVSTIGISFSATFTIHEVSPWWRCTTGFSIPQTQ